MPLLAVLAAAPQVRDGIHATQLEPHEHRHGEARREADVEPAVAVQVRRVRAVEPQPLLVGDEHRHPGAVLTGVEDLLRLVAGRIEVDRRRLEHARDAALEGVTEDGRGVEERREGVEHLVVLPLPADCADRAERREREILHESPVAREQAQPGGRIVHVVGHERVVDDLDSIEHVRGLRDDLAPAGPLGVPGIDRNDALAGGIEVGEEVEHGPIVPHERVARIEVVQQPHHLARDLRALGLLQVEVINPVPPVGTEPYLQHRIPAVVGHLGVHSPVGLVRSLVDEHVLRLIRAQAVVIEALKPVHLGERLVDRLRVPAVEEAGAIVGPRRARELDPLEVIGPVAPLRDIAHAELLPIGAARRRAVGQEPPVVRDRQGRERHRTVFGQEVRVEQRLRVRRERRLFVQDGLVLETIVLEKEVATCLPEWRAVLRIVPDLRQPLADRAARGDLGEIGGGEPVFRLDPGAAFGRVRVLEPAVRVGDPGPVIIVDDIALASGRILERLGPDRRCAREHAGQEETPREGTEQRSGHLPDKSRGS